MTDAEYRMALIRVCKDPIKYDAYVAGHLEKLILIEEIQENIRTMPTGSARLTSYRNQAKQQLREAERILADYEKMTLGSGGSGSGSSGSSGSSVDGNCLGSIGKVIGVAVVLLVLLAMCGN